MDKILNAFQNLFEGEEMKKQHFFAALLFFLPCMTATTIQMIDKDASKNVIVSLLIAGVVLLVLSLVPILMLQGLWYKFLNRRFNEPYGIPQISWDCLIYGIKGLPLAIVWSLYVSIPCFIYMGLIIGGFAYFIANYQNNTPLLIGFSLIFLILLFLIIIPLFILSPFLAMVYMKYCENFEYSKELFNPMLVFQFMKKEFKETIFTALKFIVVNFVTNIAAQIIVMAGVLLGIILVIGFGAMFIIAGNENFATQWYFLVPAVLYLSIFTTFSAYIHWITQLAYADCLEEIYVEKMIDVK